MKINENGVIRDATPEEEAALNEVPVATQEDHVVNIVSSRQFKLQLYHDNIYDDVVAWVSQQELPIKIAFENSATFIKDDDMLRLGFTALGFTEQQITDFFNNAALL